MESRFGWFLPQTLSTHSQSASWSQHTLVCAVLQTLNVQNWFLWSTRNTANAPQPLHSTYLGPGCRQPTQKSPETCLVLGTSWFSLLQAAQAGNSDTECSQEHKLVKSPSHRQCCYSKLYIFINPCFMSPDCCFIGFVSSEMQDQIYCWKWWATTESQQWQLTFHGRN